MDEIKVLKFISNFNPNVNDFNEIYPDSKDETIENIDKIILQLYYSNLIEGVIPSRNTTLENPVFTIDIYKIKLTPLGKGLL